VNGLELEGITRVRSPLKQLPVANRTVFVSIRITGEQGPLDTRVPFSITWLQHGTAIAISIEVCFLP
jgi:hypothetical protein